MEKHGGLDLIFFIKKNGGLIMKWYFLDFTEEEREELKKEVKWSDIVKKVADNKNRTIGQVIGISDPIGEKIYYKKDAQTKIALYKAFFSHSKVESATILLSEVLGIDREKMNANMVLGMLCLYMTICKLMRYLIKLKGIPAESLTVPFILESEIEDNGENNSMYR